MFYKDISKPNELDNLAIKYNSDKKPGEHNYTKTYFHYFSKIKDKKIKLLEIGVLKGASIKMWKDFFPNAEIYGLDIDPSCKEYEDCRIKIFIGDQTDRDFLKEMMKEIGPVDIIIDDGGHTMNQQKTSFEVLFPYIKKGGAYIIEDLHTSYWRTYLIDNENFLCYDSPKTMVSYIEYLIDCLNFIGAVTGIGDPSKKLPEGIKLNDFERYLVDNIASIHLYSSLCFIFKKNPG